MRRSRTITMTPPTPRAIEVYTRRGITPPTLEGPHPSAAFWPYLPRWRHKIYADIHGYYWLPCILCGREHGGHEITESIPDPTRGPGWGKTICPACAAERNGGRP